MSRTEKTDVRERKTLRSGLKFLIGAAVLGSLLHNEWEKAKLSRLEGLCPQCLNSIGGYGCSRGFCVQHGTFNTEDGP